MVERKEWLTVGEYADLIGRSVGSVYHDSRQNKIPGMTRIGRLVRIHRPTLEAAMRRDMVAA